MLQRHPRRRSNDRDVILYRIFDEFVSKRLAWKGSCNRSEVVSAFRQYNPKYRNANSEQ